MDLAFSSSEHIVRDVNNGYLLRYIHANAVSMFFFKVYAHIGKGLYYGSYRAPRRVLWILGVIIFIVKMATAFIGYVLIWGQMSLWGEVLPEMDKVEGETLFTLCSSVGGLELKEKKRRRGYKTRSSKRIGPHNLDILSVLIGSLLGDAYLEKHGNGSRFCFQQEDSHQGYLLWLHQYVSERGYTNNEEPIITKRIGNQGKIRRLLRFKTWTYSNFNWIQEAFYVNQGEEYKKIIPIDLVEEYLTPLG